MCWNVLTWSLSEAGHHGCRTRAKEFSGKGVLSLKYTGIFFLAVYFTVPVCWRGKATLDSCVYSTACVRVLKPGGVYLLVCVLDHILETASVCQCGFIFCAAVMPKLVLFVKWLSSTKIELTAIFMKLLAIIWV